MAGATANEVSGVPLPTLTYTFESLTTGAIHGQDNWVTVNNVNNPAGVTQVVGVETDASVPTHNTTKVLNFDVEGSGYGSRSTRIDNADFSTMAIPSSGVAIIEFEANRATWQTWFGMGKDLNTNGDLSIDELGLQLQLRAAGTSWKSRLTVGSSAHESTTSLGNYGKYQLHLDRTLGTASLWYRNMSAGTDWAVLPGLSEVASGFSSDTSISDPSTWNGFVVHGEGRTSVFDNLSFRQVNTSARTLTFPTTEEGDDSRLTLDVSGQYLTQPLTATATGDYTFDNGAQSTTVNAGTSLGLKFSPSQSGVRTGTVSLSSAEMLRPLTVSLNGRAAPRVMSFTSTTADGTYTTGDTINISATTTTDITAGSTLRVTLDTGAQVTLTAATQGTSLTGTYTVAAGHTSSDLTVTSFDASSTVDTAGNAITNAVLPTGVNNIAGTRNIVIAAPAATTTTIASLMQTPSTTTTTTTVQPATSQPAASLPTTVSTVATSQNSSTLVSPTASRPATTKPVNTLPAATRQPTTTLATTTTTTRPPLPSATPGQLVALVDGRRAEGSSKVDNATVILNIADIEVRIRCVRSDGSPIAPTSNGELHFEPGSQMTINVFGFQNNSDVAVEMRSTPTPLGVLRTDNTGVATAVFAVPHSLTIGNHRLVVEGNDQAGQSVTVGFGVSLRSVDGRGPIGLVVAIVFIAGIAAVFVPAEVARRRRLRR